jgi:SAM-dependent methyltransferase
MISKVKPQVLDKADKSDWFQTWFDSPYYHVLYKHRDQSEADLFLDTLINKLKLAPGSTILDVACGKGRHSIYLNSRGFDVTGFDLSAESIQHDKKFENDKLHFYLHDMREVFRSNYFDLVLNLFSSFGYFEKERDNIRCLIANATALKPDGMFVFDYFNAKKILKDGNCEMDTIVEGIKFHIEKYIEGHFIKKKISFKVKENNFHFEEQLTLTEKSEFKKYFEIAGLEIMNYYGNYKLEPFDEDASERLIIFAKKKSIR